MRYEPYVSLHNELSKQETERRHAIPLELNNNDFDMLQWYGIYSHNEFKQVADRDIYKNIIIIFAESLSLKFLRPEYNGIKITPKD